MQGRGHGLARHTGDGEIIPDQGKFLGPEMGESRTLCIPLLSQHLPTNMPLSPWAEAPGSSRLMLAEYLPWAGLVGDTKSSRTQSLPPKTPGDTASDKKTLTGRGRWPGLLLGLTFSFLCLFSD